LCAGIGVAELVAGPAFWYLGAAALYGLLGLQALVVRGGGLLPRHILFLSAAGVGWAIYSAVTGPTDEFALNSVTFGVEALFMFAWFAFLYRLLRGPYQQSMPETVRRGLVLFWFIVIALGAVVTWFVYLGDARAAGYYHVIGLSIALICFALSAQLNRDAPIENTAALRSLAGAGGLISGAEILIFGVAILTASVPMPFIIFRTCIAAAAAILAIYALRRRPQWSLEIFVSPRARAYVPRLLAMLGVLLVLLILTPLYRSMPPSNAQPLAGLLIAMTGIPIAVLLFSENLSARLRVFVSKHFLPFRFDYREEWLRLIDTLASPDQAAPLPERSIQAVAQIVGAPAGLLWLHSNDKGPFTVAANWNTRIWPVMQVEEDDPALRFMRARQWILDTAELDRDPELYDGLRRPAWLEEMPDALLVVPLLSNEDLLGFVVLLQSSSAFRLTFEEIDLLRTSGRQVAAHLAQYQADHQLAEVQQFEAFNRLTAFVMHDLKNLIAQQSLMVKNASKHKGNPEFFEDAMATIENSVARMNKLLSQLRSGDTLGPRERVGIGEVLSDAIEKTESGVPEPVFEKESDELFAEIDRERFTAVVAHLIRNAQEATSAEGSVRVLLSASDGQALISIKDDGCGMAEDFVRNRLFRPFDSTKGSQGMGIGAYQARTFVTECGGTLNVESETGQGTEVLIRLPVAGTAVQTSDDGRHSG
jgi:putative PEP-CTERM system histidine kinase